MRRIILLCLILLLTSGCSFFNKKAVSKPSATTTDILKSDIKPIDEGSRVFYKDIVYAKIAGSVNLKLDLILPKNDGQKKLPVIIGIHGGGWRAGSKENCFASEQMVQRGYAMACLGYRLSGQAIFPAQIYDIKAAARWLRANAAYYNLDTNRFGVWGNSAGAHLAVMLGVTGDVKDLEGKIGVPGYSSRVQAVVDWYGPVEFGAIIPLKNEFKEYYEAATQLIGKPLENSSDLILKASPLNYITADDPPILIMHGAKDAVVPYSQSEKLYKALTQKGIIADYYLSPNNEHEFHDEKDYKKVADWFDKYLKI